MYTLYFSLGVMSQNDYLNYGIWTHCSQKAVLCLHFQMEIYHQTSEREGLWKALI